MYYGVDGDIAHQPRPCDSSVSFPPNLELWQRFWNSWSNVLDTVLVGMCILASLFFLTSVSAFVPCVSCVVVSPFRLADSTHTCAWLKVGKLTFFDEISEIVDSVLLVIRYLFMVI